MDLKACVCSLWPVHRSSSVGWRADYLQTSHCSLRDQCRNAESGQVALQVALCWRPETLLPRKGWKTHRGKQYNSCCDLVGHKHREGAQNNEKYADRDQDTHRAALAPPPLPFTKEKSLSNCLKTNSVCSLKKSPEKVTQLSLIGNTKWHDWSSQVTSISKSTRSTNLNVKQENSGWQSWTYRLLGEHV